MGEISRPVTLDEALSHIQALFQAAPEGPPRWLEHDLTFGQLRLLFVLAQSPISVGQLADTLHVTDATASEIVDRLERRGLALRSHRSDDRRVVECRISDEGTRLLAEVVGARRAAARAALSVLAIDELTQLDALLVTMAERLSAATTPPVPAEGDRQPMSTPVVVPPVDARGMS
jgi:DNA-binding MarR family transcriptional regulator